MEKKLWAIYHDYDVGGAFGDSRSETEMVGIVQATKEEIEAFIQKYDKPIVYDDPYDKLYCHSVRAEEVEISSLDSICPYGKDDQFGLMAKEYEVRKIFDAKYGPEWMWSDNAEELRKKYEDRMKPIREQWNKEHDA